jgi:two-component system heavy metal sensor histidine kinase CusS
MLDSEDDIFIITEPGKSPVIMVNPLHAPLPEMPVVEANAPLSSEDLRSGMVNGDVPMRAATVEALSGGKVVHLTAAHLAVKEMATLANFRDRILFAVALAFVLTAVLGYCCCVEVCAPCAKWPTTPLPSPRPGWTAAWTAAIRRWNCSN